MGITFAFMQRLKTRYFIELIIHGLFWVVLYYALRGLTISSYAVIDRAAGRDAVMRSGHTLFPYAGVVLAFLVLLFYSCAFWLFKKIIRYKNSASQVAVTAGWLLLVYGANYLLVRMLPALPDTTDPIPFSMHWPQLQLIIGLAFMAVLGIAAAYFFIREWIRNELDRSQADAVQLDTELRFLRSQVNPHFLFNTLNNLFSMAVKERKSSLADRIAKLSGMMRYMLYESNTAKVPLVKEVECLKDYLTLQGMRYAPGEADMSFQYPDPAAITGVQVAPMLFIPFLENAFKHGVALGEQSYIAMSIAVSGQQLVFSCENTDHSAIKKQETEKGGIGLENVKRRLELIYPGRYALRAGPQNGKYMVDLQIDLS